MNAIIDVFLAQSPWEMAAVALAIAYLLLALAENNWCWLCAFVSTAIYTVLFWEVSLLMESVLNIYYMAMAIYGWQQWRRGGDGEVLAITRWRLPQHLVVLALIAMLTIVTGFIMSRNTDAAWPYIDSLTTWASVVTTFLVAKKVLENWLYWIVIDAVSIFLYLDRSMNLTAMLYVAYVVIAVFGFLAWRRHLDGGGDSGSNDDGISRGNDERIKATVNG
jgi:nicotinamide mononucleotide transporter